MLRNVVRCTVYTAFFGLSWGLSSGVSAQETAKAAPNPELSPSSALSAEDDLFHPGGSCASLAYLSPTHLADLIKSGFSDDRHSFCVPEEPAECSEYTGLLSGQGRLTTGEDGFHCNLQVNP